MTPEEVYAEVEKMRTGLRALGASLSQVSQVMDLAIQESQTVETDCLTAMRGIYLEILKNGADVAAYLHRANKAAVIRTAPYMAIISLYDGSTWAIAEFADGMSTGTYWVSRS